MAPRRPLQTEEGAASHVPPRHGEVRYNSFASCYEIYDEQSQEYVSPDSDLGKKIAISTKAIRATRVISAAELQIKQFAPVRWVVPDLIPQGLTILAGAPKLGKSWLVLDIALAVAQGGPTLGDRQCPEGRVLYCALEDGERRLQERMAKICPDDRWPANLGFTTEMPNLAEGGIEFLRDWAAKAEKPSLIIVDTFAKVRPTKKRDETQYDADYGAAGMLKRLADEIGVGVIMVHHTRKLGADDPFDTVSGTNGLTGAADTILVLKREGGGATLYGRGRDIEEAELALRFERAFCRWRLLGAADEVRASPERRAVLDALRCSGAPMTIADVAAATGHPGEATKKLLFRMFEAGELQRPKRGRYSLPE